MELTKFCQHAWKLLKLFGLTCLLQCNNVTCCQLNLQRNRRYVLHKNTLCQIWKLLVSSRKCVTSKNSNTDGGRTTAHSKDISGWAIIDPTKKAPRASCGDSPEVLNAVTLWWWGAFVNDNVHFPAKVKCYKDHGVRV